MKNSVNNIPRRRGAYLAVVLLPLFMFACSGDANENDAVAVRDRFIAVRFVAPFRDKLRGLSDKELFQLSCRDKRVSCKKVLEILETKDPAFVKILKADTKGKSGIKSGGSK